MQRLYDEMNDCGQVATCLGNEACGGMKNYFCKSKRIVNFVVNKETSDIIEMEDINKYVFDPENPKDFKVYNLLLEILKENNYAVFIDPFFLSEIFYDEVWDDEGNAKIWDKPENFEELSGVEKSALFIKQRTPLEFIEFFKKKIGYQLEKKLSNSIFKNFVRISSETIAYDFQEYQNYYLDTDFKSKIIESYENLTLAKTIENKLDENCNYIFILSKNYLSKIVNDFSNIKKTNILICNKLDYNQEYDAYLKPILLKKSNDINFLLNILKNDLNKEKAIKENPPTEISYLKNIQIKNYFSIKEIELKETELQNSKEIYFVGENGDGKSIVLQGITLALIGNKPEFAILLAQNDEFNKKNRKSNENSENLFLQAIDSKEKEYTFKELDKDQETKYQNIFAYGVHRFYNSRGKEDRLNCLTLFTNDYSLMNPVKWFTDLDYAQLRGDKNVISLDTAKNLFNELLDKNIKIEIIDGKVIFIEKGTELNFEQLSDGNKILITWFADLLARLSEKQPYVESLEEFAGIVLVDEIDLFLHPKRQYELIKKLRTKFPNIQWIFTTHSPSLLMGASADAVFFRVYKEEGNTQIEKVEIDIANINPSMLISSPLFDTPSVPISNKEFKKYQTNKSYLDAQREMENDKYLEEKEEFIKKLNSELFHDKD